MPNNKLPNIKALLVPSHYVFESHTRGSEYRHAFEISNAIATEWPNSVVITGKITENDKFPYRIIEVQPDEAVYEMTFVRAIKFSIRYTIAAARIKRKEHFDVLHHVRPFQIGYTFNLIQLLGLNKGSKFIIGSFSSPYAHETRSKIYTIPIKFILNQLSIWTMKSADRVIVYDYDTKNMIRKWVKDEKIRIITPGVDGSLYKPSKKDYKGFIKFISVGYLIPRKRFDYLIRVFKELYLVNSNISLDIYGDGEQKAYLNDLIKDLNLEGIVILKGFVNNLELSSIYGKSHIFISLQEEESFGQVYIEAMACGLPIITTINKGSDLIIDDAVGMKFTTNDDIGLHKSLVNLLNSPDVLNQMSLNARNKFLKVYDSQIIAQQWVDLYVELLAQSDEY